MNRLASRFALLATVAGLAATSAGAQSTAVFPQDHADPAGPNGLRNGSTWTANFPFSWGVARQMMIYEAGDLTIPNGANITRIGFPTDNGSNSSGTQVRLQMFMGYTTNDASNASTTYEQNYAQPKVEVFTQKIFTLPSLGTMAGHQPQVWVPLDTPFQFDTSRNLVVEFVVDANAMGNASFNYWIDRATVYSPSVSFGSGCASSSGTVPEIASGPVTKLGGTWTLTVSRAPASSNCFANVGLMPAPAPIPVPMASGCEGLVLPIATGSGTTSASGRLSWNVAVPNDLAFYDAHLYSQGIVLDLFANPLGAVFTNGDDVRIGVDPRCALIRNQTDLTRTTGSISRNYGVVTLFDYQ